MRGRLCLAGTGLLMLGGCGQPNEASVPEPAPAIIDAPAGSAGGACHLLDFALIEQITGVAFDVAAASERGDTHTCAIRSERAAKPDLTLSVTETSIDASAFKADVVPDGASGLKGLGKAAYQLTLAPTKKQGPVVEIGWLAADGRLASLHFTFAAGQDRAAATDIGPKLVTLAKRVNPSAL